MRISKADWDELVAHARDDEPNECCGYAPMKDGRVERVVRARNLRNSPYGYELDAKGALGAVEAEEEGYDIALYHSHPKSPAEPSQTDINIAFYPQWLYVIVSLAGEPEVRAWRIADGRVEEEDIVVE
jgi:proteasome lid subunit RPN8/RPN11